MHPFKRRHLYAKRNAHHRWNKIIASGFALFILMSWIAVSPVKAQEAPQGLIGPVEPIPTLSGGTEAQNEVIRYAWQISRDMDFIYTLNGENGTWDYRRVHNPRANKVGTDMGFGINSYWHPEIVTDPRFMTDWKWQLEQAYKMWAGGVKFYAYSTKGIIN